MPRRGAADARAFGAVFFAGARPSPLASGRGAEGRSLHRERHRELLARSISGSRRGSTSPACFLRGLRARSETRERRSTAGGRLAAVVGRLAAARTRWPRSWWADARGAGGFAICGYCVYITLQAG